jgi:hypothetical protein
MENVMANQTKYATYSEVPYYRKQWFFWVTYLIIPIIPIILLMLGDVYYQGKDGVKSFGIANRIVAGIIAVIYIIKIISSLTEISG